METNSRLILIIQLFSLFIVSVFCSSFPTDKEYLSKPVNPQLARFHHRKEVQEHAREGNRLAIDALQKGMKTSYSLGKKAISKTMKCEFGSACKLLNKSWKASSAGVAGCCNVSVYSHTSMVKHFTKSKFGSNNKQQSRTEFFQKKLKDQEKREYNYAKFEQQNDSFINDHH